MDLSAIKNELYNFTDNLYNTLKEEVNECSSLEDVNEILKEEHKNISDYKKILQLSILDEIKNELMDRVYAGDAIKAADEIEQEITDIHIPLLEVDENNIYIEESDEAIAIDEPIVIKEESQKKKPTKTMIVICSILLGFLIGVVIKKDILNGIIMGFIGAAFGFSIYEMYFAEDNKNLEKLIKRENTINKKLDKSYLNILIHERKKSVETILINYINEFNNVLEKKTGN